MHDPLNHRYLLKFVIVSVTSFFIGSVHGVLQLAPPIRAWLDSIGSPYGGPGHMIDPLAHAHINLIGGVMMLAIATTYYLVTTISQRPMWSPALVKYSFWLTLIGVTSFYSTLMIFGIWEGMLLLASDPAIDAVHSIYGPTVAIAATIMGTGLWLFMANVAITLYVNQRQS